jgi:hypothetical protein
MASRSVRELLVARTGWNAQRLSDRVQKLRRVTPVSTSTAHAVLAHQQGIKVDKHLDAAQLQQVRDVLSRLSQPVVTSTTSQSTSARRPTGKTLRLPKLSDPLLPPTKLAEAAEMAAVFPLVYVLENSIREVVRRVLSAKYGADWWNTALTSGSVKNLKDSSDAKRARELQTGWHQRRGAHPIDYIDLGQLAQIVFAKQDDFFPHVLGDNRRWFEQFMVELEPSRNVLCHMNPLTALNAKDLSFKLGRWQELVSQRAAHIPVEAATP